MCREKYPEKYPVRIEFVVLDEVDGTADTECSSSRLYICMCNHRFTAATEHAIAASNMSVLTFQTCYPGTVRSVPTRGLHSSSHKANGP